MDKLHIRKPGFFLFLFAIPARGMGTLQNENTTGSMLEMCLLKTVGRSPTGV